MLKMTYKNKTITRHQRGNWYVRVRRQGQVVCLYGDTQMAVYEKLKILCDVIESEKINDRLSKLRETIYVPQEVKKVAGYTLLEWFDKWLATYKVGNLRQSSIYDFKKNIKQLKGLHDKKLAEISNMMLQQAISEIKSDRAKDKAHNLLKQLFRTAFENGVIRNNPSSNIPRPKQFAKNQKTALTQSQEKRFIEICLKDLNKYEPILVCVLQGLRKGELLALRPNDFCFVNNTLRIDESYDIKFPEDLRTKNATSNRVMPMFEITRQVLLKYKDHEPNKRIYEHTSYETIKRNFEKMLLLNDLPRITMHELRHTFISRCHEKGIDEMIVQKWVGHAIGSRMTKAVYTHIDNDTEQKYIELLNKK